MLGLAILFGLFVWVVITLIAMKIGYKIGKKVHYPKMGALAGFMLLMGGWFLYWAIEFAYIQAKVSHLCEKEAGITVYVTPEQWRKQIGEEEWNNLPEDWKNISSKLQFQFQGKIYCGDSQLNRRVIAFTAKDERKDIIRDEDTIYVDKNTNQVLFREHHFSVGAPAIANSLSGLKGWLNDIDDCYIGNWSYENRFFHTNYTNFSITKGN